MNHRQQPLLMVIAVFSLVGVIGIFVMKTSLISKYPQDLTLASPSLAERFRQQRNEVSRMLNEAKRELAVTSCELIDFKRKENKTIPQVSVAGGWCKKNSLKNSGRHFFDKPLAVALSYIFENKTVGSFGDGPGDYKRFFDGTNRLSKYDAYDGAPYTPETTEGAVQFLDLTASQYGLPVYDWIISLEVAEHIPRKYESIYIDNIVRHAAEGVVLSWAVPGQNGLSHVNNRPLYYVKNLLTSKGFDQDNSTSIAAQHNASLPWLRRNVYIYRRRKNSYVDADNA